MLLAWMRMAGAGHVGDSMESGVAAGFALAVGVVGWALRGRLAAGLGAGTGIVGLSAATVLVFVRAGIGGGETAAIGHALTVLAVIWTLRSRLSHPERDGVVRSLAEQAAIACGVGAIAYGVLGADLAQLSTSDPASVDLAVLLVVSVLAWVTGGTRFEPYAVVLIPIAVLGYGIRHIRLNERTLAIPVILNVLAAIALAGVLVLVLAAWWARRRAWIAEPIRPVRWPLERDRNHMLVVAICVGVGGLGVILRGTGWTPLAMFMSALAAFGVAHLATSRFAGEVGLALLGVGVAMLPGVFGWSSADGSLFGVAIAGGYLLWLARFWQQQLRDGVPWTTTGRLIPVARRLAIVGAAVACMVTIVRLAQPFTIETTNASTVIATLTLLGLAALFVRDGLQAGGLASMGGSVLALVAATEPLLRWLQDWAGWTLAPIVILAAGALLWCVRTAAVRSERVCETTYNAYIGGAMPVAVLCAAALDGGSGQSLSAVGLVAAAVAIGLWSRRGAVSPAVGVRAGDSVEADTRRRMR